MEDQKEKTGAKVDFLPENPIEAVFIDRDGTMCQRADVEYPQEFQPLEGLSQALREIRETGAKMFVFSNQSCIAKGKDGGYDFAGQFSQLGFDDWFICPHRQEDGCLCRKPGTALLEQAQKKYGLSMENCWVIGDRWSDMLAGGRMGCRLLLVLTGRGKEALEQDRHLWEAYTPDFIAQDLTEAAAWLKQRFQPCQPEFAPLEHSQGEESEALAGLPQDPAVLLSYVNTSLRDSSMTLEDFCREKGVSKEALCRKLEQAGYEYNEDLRKFW